MQQISHAELDVSDAKHVMQVSAVYCTCCTFLVLFHVVLDEIEEKTTTAEAGNSEIITVSEGSAIFYRTEKFRYESLYYQAFVLKIPINCNSTMR